MWGGFREAIVQKYGRASVAWVWHDCIYTKIAARPGAGFYLHKIFGRPGSGILSTQPFQRANAMSSVTLPRCARPSFDLGGVMHRVRLIEALTKTDKRSHISVRFSSVYVDRFFFARQRFGSCCSYAYVPFQRIAPRAPWCCKLYAKIDLQSAMSFKSISHIWLSFRVERLPFACEWTRRAF